MRARRERRHLPHSTSIFLILFGVISFTRSDAYSQTSGEWPVSPSHAHWQVGASVAGGFVPNYWVHDSRSRRSVELNFINAGALGGRFLTAPRGPEMLRGRPEAIIEVFPFWHAGYPPQIQSFTMPGFYGVTQWGPYSIWGASVTPVLIRWNFMRHDTPRAVPWAQLGGGLLWTDHKFPYLGGNTSVINFTPQIGFGESVFVKRNRSLDLAMKVINITNAGLGENNPGINFTFQFSIGYSWWK